MKRKPRDKSMKFTTIDVPNDPVKDFDHGFVEDLLDVRSETALLEEIKDIRDELDMLSLLFQYQDQVLPAMKDAIESLGQQEKWSPGVRQ